MIGSWVARFTDIRLTKWHLVESEINGRPVVRCGRQLAGIEGTERRYEEAPSSDRCYYCERPKQPATPGDEPLTA